jgi:Raf kinase inhibitor-like YbhB/YbcL family protein
MKSVASFFLLTVIACAAGACSSTVTSGADTKGGDAGTGGSDQAGTGGSAGAGRSAAGTAGGAQTSGTAGAGGSAGAQASSAGTGGASGEANGGTGGEQGAFALSSSAFVNKGSIDEQYLCGSTGVSPPLSWTAGPAGTKSYAVVMVGPDSTGATGAYHWVIWNIPAATASLPQAVAQMAMPPAPAGSSQISPGTDGATWPGYAAPCPSLPTTYTFTVFALNVATLPGVTSASSGADVFAAIQASAIASAQLTGIASSYRS